MKGGFAIGCYFGRTGPGRFLPTQQELDSAGAAGGREPVDVDVWHVEVCQRPQNHVPDCGMAFVAQKLEDDLEEAEVPDGGPGTALVFLRQVVLNRKAKSRDIPGEKGEIGPAKSQELAAALAHAEIVTVGRAYPVANPSLYRRGIPLLRSQCFHRVD